MLNSISLIGKVVETIKDGNNFYVMLAVKRFCKNNEGKFLTDIIKCRIWKNILKNVTERYPVGCNLAVNGRLCTYGGEYYVECYEVSYIGSIV